MKPRRWIRLFAIGLTGGILLQGAGCVGAWVTIAASLVEANALTAVVNNL